MECEEFLIKLKQIPNRITRDEVLNLGGTIIVKTKNIVDFMMVMYKLLPEDLRNARKKNQKSIYQSFKYLDLLDKLFMSKGFMNKNGLAIVKKKELENIITNICNYLPNDEKKVLALRAQ